METLVMGTLAAGLVIRFGAPLLALIILAMPALVAAAVVWAYTFVRARAVDPMRVMMSADASS